jgi:hypothetical protein
MADNDKLNGSAAPQEEAPKSLRQIAEDSYNEIETTADDTAPEPEPTGERQRDEQGRFVSKPQGEQPAAGEPAPGPALEDDKASAAAPSPAPAQPGEATGAPQHWSAEDRAMFDKQTPEAQAFLLKRHSDMERDYTQKTQANAQAINFVHEIAPIFEDPAMQAALVAVDGTPVSASYAISQWAGFHRRAMDRDPRVRMGLLFELTQNMGFDPAAIFGQTRQPVPGLSEEEQADPAIRYFADQLGRAFNDVQSLRNDLQSMRTQDAERQSAEAVRVSRWQIDSFADEKDAQGRPLHPHFDAVLPEMMELFRANPNRDLKEAYETAVWMKPDIRQSLLTSERQTAEQQRDNQRAAQAARSNVRGRTSPVTKPESTEEPKGLRATIAASAEEVGF